MGEEGVTIRVVSKTDASATVIRNLFGVMYHRRHKFVICIQPEFVILRCAGWGDGGKAIRFYVHGLGLDSQPSALSPRSHTLL